MTVSPWKFWALAVIGGLLLAAAFPPLNWWPLALIALAPLLVAVLSRGIAFQGLPLKSKVPPNSADKTPEVEETAENVTSSIPGTQESGGLVSKIPETHGREPRAPFRFWPGFRLGWIFGFVFFTATLWWIQHVTLPGMLALCAYLALYPAVAMGIFGWLGLRREDSPGAMSGKLLLAAGAWAGLEWVRSVALSGFPWNGLAVPLFESPSLRLISSYSGVHGLGLIVFFVNGLVVLSALLPHPAVFGWVSRLAWFFIFQSTSSHFLEQWFGSTRPAKPVWLGDRTAILVQPNLTMEEKMSPDPEAQRQRYFDLVEQTEKALEANKEVKLDNNVVMRRGGLPFAELVVWPESAVPGFFDEMLEGGAFVDLLKMGEFSLVTGSDDRDWDKLYNSIAIMRGTTDNRALQPKVRLVPFGEFIPFRKQVPLFEKMLGNLIPMDFNAGTSLEPMRVKDQPFSIVPLVCFEDTIGAHARKFIRAEPQVLVNVTNDNWFHESPATEMHFVNARWRAVELQRTLVRSANTGVTAIVSPWGDVQRIPSHQKGVLSGQFHPGNATMTFYAEHGDLFSVVAGSLGLLGCVVIFAARRRKALPVQAGMTSL